MSASARREQVDYALSRGASVRRSCALLQVSRSALRYASRMPARDAELGVELQRIAAAHPRYGHRFAWALVRRTWRVNRKRVRRVWRALGLCATRKKRRKIRTGMPRPLTPTGPNQVWALDFIHDTCGNNQAIKCLSVVDECTRECLAILVAGSITALAVITVLEQLIQKHGAPEALRSDNGPEFIARALQAWAIENNIAVATIAPGKPWQNGSVESFHATFRGECLDREWFAHRREAKIVIEQWRWEYNTQRPHSSLGYRTPAEVGLEARVAMTQESDPKEIDDPGATVEAVFLSTGLAEPINTGATLS